MRVPPRLFARRFFAGTDGSNGRCRAVPERVIREKRRCPPGRSDPAVTSFAEAIRIARGQSAKLFELRAAVCLARLWSEQGKRAEAGELLAPTYEWFTEGFNLRDLKEAKALLDELKVKFDSRAITDCPADGSIAFPIHYEIGP